MTHEKTQQEYNKTQESSTASIEDKVDNILSVLTGTLEGKEGIVSMVKKMANDVYGKDSGIIVRIRRLEEQQEKRSAWLSGATFVGGIVGAFLAWIGQLIFGTHK